MARRKAKVSRPSSETGSPHNEQPKECEKQGQGHFELQPAAMTVQPAHMTVASRRKMPAAARISFM